ncbi:MAG: hypothetical protein M1820_005280 [Bogoriella megaspora]|nr:MAG: hypothetical protein M1820_005280 [Bogoriella megaspora]
MAYSSLEFDNALARVVEATRNNQLQPNLTTHAELINSIHRFRDVVETPGETLQRIRRELYPIVCTRIIIENGILDELVKKTSIDSNWGFPAQDLAVSTGNDQSQIVRVLRLLAATNIVEEVDEETYKTTPVANLLHSPMQVGMVKQITNGLIPIMGQIAPFMQSHSNSLESPRENGLWEFTHGKPMFEQFQTDLAMKADFDAAMSGRRLTDPWYTIYPANTELQISELKPDRALAVDVGGGKGHDLVAFRQAFPDLPGECILEDLPETLAPIREKSKNHQGISTVTLKEYDFFTPQPVKGARIYFFREVLHNWPDSRALAILKNTVSAMDSNYSRILIEEVVVPAKGAGAAIAGLDIAMMLMLGGMERTAKQWKKLLDDAGLEIVKIWEQRGNPASVIEAKIKTAA